MRKSGSLKGIACDRRCVIVEVGLIRREDFLAGSRKAWNLCRAIPSICVSNRQPYTS